MLTITNTKKSEDGSNITQLLKELKPDIFALQELTSGFKIHGGQDVAALIAKELGYNYYEKLTAKA